MKNLAGEVVGNYRIESLIDEGGMGRVYRARHVLLDRPAAIKIMLPELEAIPGYRSRFHQEARAAAALRHTNVVQVYDFGEQGGRFYLAMELVPDGNLLRLMRGKMELQPLSLALGLDLVSQAALGLDYAHERGMVHRDVKPANLLLESSSPRRGRDSDTRLYTLKVSDFGLARLKEGGIETSIGKVRGTLAYMSPEQCRGNELDGRSDLYALGVILFELSTGRRPFDVRTPTDALYKHIYEQPPRPRSLRPELPQDLEAIIMRCLAKAPGERHSSCADLAADLQSLVGRGVLAGDSAFANTQAGEQAEVITSLHSISVGAYVEPADALEGDVERDGEADAQSLQGQGTRSGLPTVRAFDDQGRTHSLLELTGDGLTVGGLPGNDMVLEAGGVSRHHLRIDWDGSAAEVTDLGSRNGTHTRDGQRLAAGQKCRWRPGEPLRVGGFWLRLEGVSASPAAAAAPIVVGPTRTAGEAEDPGQTSPAVTEVRAGEEASETSASTETHAIEEANVAHTAPGSGEAATSVGDGATQLEASASGEATGANGRRLEIGPIVLSLQPVQLRLVPGLPSELVVRIENQGSTLGNISLAVEGVPQDWVGSGSLSALGPGQAGTVTLAVLVPPDPSSRPGHYPVLVRAIAAEMSATVEGAPASSTTVTSGLVGGAPDGSGAGVVVSHGSVGETSVGGARRQLPFTASGRWTVCEVAKSSLVLHPTRIRALRVAEYGVRLTNEGNHPSTYDLGVIEAESGRSGASATGDGQTDARPDVDGSRRDGGRLVYEFSQPKVTLEPGQTAELALRVEAPARLMGAEETRSFEVSARTSNGGAPPSARAELVRRAVLPLWATLAAAALLALSAVAVLISTASGLPQRQLAEYQGPAATATPDVELPSPTVPAFVLSSPTRSALAPDFASSPAATPTEPSVGPPSTPAQAQQISTAASPSPGADLEPSATATPLPADLPVAPTTTPTRTPTWPPTATPCARPAIGSFTVSQKTIIAGQSATLSWSARGASDASIDQGIGPVPVTGQWRVVPAGTTTYTLKVSGCGGTDTRQVPITVQKIPLVNRLSPASNDVLRVLPRTATFTWGAIGSPAGLKYNIEIEYNNGAWVNLAKKLDLAGTSYTTSAFTGDGQIRWRVWATATGATDGLPGDWWYFRFSTSARQYSATWVNEKANSGITKIIISDSGQTLYVHPYYHCLPSDCDWGTTPGTFSGEPFVISVLGSVPSPSTPTPAPIVMGRSTESAVQSPPNAAPHQLLTITLANSAGTRLKVVRKDQTSGATETYYFTR